MPPKRDLTGCAFGRLTVVAEKGQTPWGAYIWTCRCECGEVTDVRSPSLISGATRSCGCLAREVASMPRSHGMSRSDLYRRWQAMWARVSNPNHREFDNYGGRGIKICKRWESFENFRDDMVSEFVPNLELERIDNNSDYEPTNCRWATHTEQNRNKRTNHLVTHQGVTQTVQDWGEQLGIKPNTILTRLRRGWSVERALEITNA